MMDNSRVGKLDLGCQARLGVGLARDALRGSGDSSRHGEGSGSEELEGHCDGLCWCMLVEVGG